MDEKFYIRKLDKEFHPDDPHHPETKEIKIEYADPKAKPRERFVFFSEL